MRNEGSKSKINLAGKKGKMVAGENGLKNGPIENGLIWMVSSWESRRPKKRGPMQSINMFSTYGKLQLIFLFLCQKVPIICQGIPGRHPPFFDLSPFFFSLSPGIFGSPFHIFSDKVSFAWKSLSRQKFESKSLSRQKIKSNLFIIPPPYIFHFYAMALPLDGWQWRWPMPLPLVGWHWRCQWQLLLQCWRSKRLRCLFRSMGGGCGGSPKGVALSSCD